MARTNLANGGNTYCDLVIQTVAAGADSYTLRSVVYLKSLNVVDSNNGLSIGGGWWSRSGALGLNGVYNYVPVWYSDIVVNRQVGADTLVGVSMSWSGVEYWGVTLSATEYYTVPAKIVPPSAPYGYSTRDITTTSATTTGVSVASNGGAGLSNLRAQVNTSQSESGATVITAGSWTDVVMSGRTRATQYYFRLAAANSAGWGNYGAWVGFRTLAEIPVMGSTYSAYGMTRNSAIIGSISLTDNGGESPNNVRVQYNTTQSEVGATVVTRGSWGDVTIPGLTDLTTYQYRVAAANSAGWGAYGPWKSFTTLDDAPDDMAAPTFSSVGNTGFTANWVAPSMNGATFVAYFWQLSRDPAFSTIEQSGTTTALSQVFTGKLPGTRYYFRVRANATPNNGGFGIADQLTTGITPNSGLRMYACLANEIPARHNLSRYPIPLSTAAGLGNAPGGAGTLSIESSGGPAAGVSWLKFAITTATTTGPNLTAASPPNTRGAIVTPGETFTTSVDVISSGLPIQIQLLFYQSNGTTLAGSASIPAVSAAAGVWTRMSITAVVPAGAMYQRTLVQCTQAVVPVGGYLGTTRLLVEQTSATGTYFDGSTAGCSWDGTSGQSASTMAAIPAVIKQGQLYTFVGGVRKQIKPMYAHDGVIETE